MDDKCFDLDDPCFDVHEYPPDKEHVVKMVNYLWMNKHIPEEFPDDILKHEKELPEQFVPYETTCPYCPGPTSPQLSTPKIVTKNAVVYGLFKVHKGGVLHMGCMHSVVFYHFPLWQQECARDHSDALLSFKHPPNMYISDIASRVARHTNNHTEQKCFQQHGGRLCAATEENIQSAQEKTLKIDLPWLAALKFKGLSVQTEHAAADRYTQVHPFTGTKDRYSLYDRFHEKNQTRPE
ncbi:hypothetical protein EOD39_18402 [Acipenser ruthenus]|uniref:Uncharacterized protein n=1 Tax=Acipenser ruthenus TaxID=7906 RepID=A0A444V100_ACIRT|nr:hypothetical protein EOD39_18402 [Acipenser ruthenus]